VAILLSDFHQQAQSLHPFYGDFLDALNAVLLASFGSRVRFATQLDTGRADADGSAADPFNPSSNANPIQQAIDSIPAPVSAADEDTAWLIVLLGGPAPAAPVTVNANRRQLAFYAASGSVNLTGITLNRVVAAATAGGTLAPTLVMFGGQFLGFTAINVGDAGAGIAHSVNLDSRLTVLDVGVTGAQTGVVTWNAHRMEQTGGLPGFVIPLADCNLSECIFDGAVSVRTLVQYDHCRFGNNVTVTAAPGGSRYGRQAEFTASISWTGPAGSANFDEGSAESFRQAGAAFAGGAGFADFVIPTEQRLATVPFDLVANNAVVVDLTVPAQMTSVRCSIVTNSAPASAGGTVLLTATVTNGAAAPANYFAAASVDLETLVAGTVLNIPLTATGADLRHTEGALLIFTATSNNADMTGGVNMRIQVDAQYDDRPRNL